MEQRELGRTGLIVTRIGLGLAAVGRPAYINVGREADLGRDRSVDDLRTRSGAVLDAAVAGGIGYVDAARSYGLAESFLGSWLAARSPGSQPPVVGSKWGYAYVGDWRMDAAVHEVKDHSLAAFRRQLVESRAILGDNLRLYQVHSATLESGILDDPGVLAALLELRASGIAVGLSVSGPKQADVVRRALDVRVEGANPFQTVQATWNLLERSVEAALVEAHEAGLGIIVKEALANGRLVGGAATPPPAPLLAIATEHGVGPDAIAITAALTRPWADIVLSGAATTAQLTSNLQAVDVSLAPSESATLDELVEPADAYWEARSRLTWH